MKSKWGYIIVGGAFVLIPIALYFLLPLPQMCNGLGGAEIWLGFWGSYLGGVFTAIIGIITLLYSNRQYHKQIEIEYKKEYVRQLEQSLAESISIFNASKIQTFLFVFNNNGVDSSDAKLYLHEMNEYCEDIQRKLRSFGLLYQDANTTKSEQKAFCELYTNLSQTYVDIISEMQNNIFFLIENTSNALAQQYLASVIKEVERIINTQSHVDDLFKLAQDWLKIEREELLNMQE